MSFTKETLERYVALDKQIHEEESKNAIKSYNMKEAQVQELQQEALQKLQDHYDNCLKNTAKEKKDVDQLTNLQELFDQASFDAKMTKEQEEYMDALNEEEIAKRELDDAKEKLESLKKELEKLSSAKDALDQLYQEQDELLASIFAGNYGSELEHSLETRLDLLRDKKQRIQGAQYKWNNSKQLLSHAVSQLTKADNKWKEIQSIPPTNGKARYDAATEARNNLIAASQNLTNTQKYLSNIIFPYCAPPEIVTLNRAIHHIYTDMMTEKRHSHAGAVYDVTRRRAAALLQWFDNVIRNTINKDIEMANFDANTVEIDLRRERLRLIKNKIEEESGEINIDVSGELELGKEAESDDVTEHISKANPEDAEQPATKTAAIPLDQLAPAPSQDQIFGEMESLKKQHEEELKEFEKAQELNKARSEQGLQEKLAARRNRRERMMAATE